MPRLALALAATAVLVGCRTMSQSQIDATDAGPAPALAEFQPQIEAMVRPQMKDPESARFRWPDPYVPRKVEYPIGGFKSAVGWLIPFDLNGKNSFGGYVGFESWDAIVRFGQIVAVNRSIWR